MEDFMVKSVDVLGSDIIAAKDSQGIVWAGVSYFCKALGMTNKQRDTQVEKVQTDKTLRKGVRKFPGGVFDPVSETVAIKVDFVPLWLAKISITDKMQNEHQELAEKLLNYQLKAKDILAEAFLPHKFKEAKKQELHCQCLAIPVGEVASLAKVMDRIMVRQNSKPHEIARAFDGLCRQFGICLPDDFVKFPEYEQLKLSISR